MEELSAKLAEILNDPESMNKVRNMAESLLGGQEEEEKQQSPAIPDITGMMNSGELSAIMGIMNRLKNTQNDSRAQLLIALRPHLSEPRREKVDTAIKILKVIELLPYLRESGLFNF